MWNLSHHVIVVVLLQRLLDGVEDEYNLLRLRLVTSRAGFPVPLPLPRAHPFAQAQASG